MKNHSSPRLYESGSESESEIEYGTDSDSNVNEGTPCKGKSLQLSHFTPTSEYSANDSFHTDSEKHTKLRPSDVISCITSQQSDITVASITQSPPAQVMDRNSCSDGCQSPGFSRSGSESISPSGSEVSGESLFSLQINSNSFTNQLDEMRLSNINKSNELVESRQPRPEAKSLNTSIGETIEIKNVHDHEELSYQVSEGLPRMNHSTHDKNDFVLPLTFPKSMEKNTNGMTEKNKKKKKKKEKGACLSCFSCRWPSCDCKFPTCSSTCCSCPSCSCKCLSCSGWPSCSSKCLSCSGCCKCP